MCELGRCPEIPQGQSHEGRKKIEVSKQILIALWYRGSQEPTRSISLSDRFNITRSSVHTCCRRVFDAVKNNLAARVIQWPKGRKAAEVMDGFEVHKAFPSVIGAIDGSYIPIKAPIECPENYVNRKNFHSVVLQVVCDHEMRFTDCYCG